MGIEYLGLSRIKGPLVAIDGVKGAAYDEIVELRVDDDARTKKLGKIIEKSINKYGLNRSAELLDYIKATGFTR